MRGRGIALRAAVVLLGSALLSGACFARDRASLDGEWEFVYAEASTPPGDAAGWQKVGVPSVLSWRPEGPHCVWYRRSFSVPESWAGRRVVLGLDAVKYAHRVYLNGREIGGHIGGYEPSEYDLSGRVEAGGRYELLVAAEDWTALIAPGAEAEPVDRSADFASWIRDGILAPIGSRGWEVGIWQSVWLEARPAVWVKDVFVAPSVRSGTLGVQITVRNDGMQRARVAVGAEVVKGGPGPRFSSSAVIVGPGEETVVHLVAAWPEARLWSPESPHLYTLRAEANGDSVETRFGFREFRTEDGRFMLNGRPINLLATAAHPMNRYDDDPARAYALARSAGCVAMRLHAQPWAAQWYEAADETGMLLVWESALWCLSPNYALSREEFWERAREHITAQVKLHRNHPSVVIWSAENELLLCGGDAVAGTESKLGELGDLIRELDPTRPVMFDGDGDPAGKADIINLHYPHEYPKWNLWPETAYWFDAPVVLDTYPGGEWQWDRAKPLYLGEFLWVPAAEMNAASVFFGDAAYPDTDVYHRKGKAAAWEMQVIAARDAGVNGVCPWNLWEMGEFPNVGFEAHRRAYQPLAAFAREASTRFFASTAAQRTFAVLNDSGSRRELELRWRLEPAEGGEGQWLVRGAERVSLGTAERTRVPVQVATPEIEDDVARARFTVELWEGEKRVFSESQTWKLYRRDALSGPVPEAPERVALYDPRGETARLLPETSVAYTPITESNAREVLEGTSVAVVGKEAFEKASVRVVGEKSSLAAALLEFVEGGGTLLVFEQEHYPGSLLPLSLTDHDSTIAFRRDSNHRALAGVEEGDLAHWAPDGVVGRREMVKPARGGFLALVDSGGPGGLETAGLAEMRVGAGRMVLCQLDVTGKFGVDPVATRIVRNLLSDAGQEARRPAPTGVLCDDAAARRLEAIGLDYERLEPPLSRAGLRGYGQVLICDVARAAEGAAALRRFVRGGGRVVLHGLTPETAAAAQALVGEAVPLRAGCDGRVKLADRRGPAAGISNQELAWFSAASRSPHAAPALSSDIAQDVVERPYRELGPPIRIEAEAMEVRWGQRLVQPEEGGTVAALYSNGELATAVQVANRGKHAVRVRARGTPAEGAYPRVTIVVDGAVAGSFAPAGEGWQTLTRLVDLPAGEHTLGLVFGNDLQTATEDRNLWVDWIAWVPVELTPTPLRFHTEPGVLVSVAHGDGLWVVDQVRWDQAGENGEKAARYLAGLLTNLGCRFEHEAGVVVEAGEMSVRDAAAWQRTDGGVLLASAGVLETEVEFASGGDYVFAVRASGTPLDDVYPVVEVRVDGEKVGSLELDSGNWQTYEAAVRVDAGRRRIALAFVNDEYRPPEDRNLVVGRLTIREAKRKGAL